LRDAEAADREDLSESKITRSFATSTVGKTHPATGALFTAWEFREEADRETRDVSFQVRNDPEEIV
jgi:hypothetical protein